MKDTKYPSTCEGNVGSSGTQQVVSSATVVNPCFISFCRWPDIIVEGVQSYSTMAQKGRGSNTSKILVLLLIPFLSLSFCPSFFSSHREGGMERTADHAKGCWGA
jgi:hypothetical protein